MHICHLNRKTQPSNRETEICKTNPVIHNLQYLCVEIATSVRRTNWHAAQVHARKHAPRVIDKWDKDRCALVSHSAVGIVHTIFSHVTKKNEIVELRILG